MDVTSTDLPAITIALVRHGETEWNRQRRWQGREGVGLNDLGRLQAAGAAPLLADGDWGWMVSSPLERARQTAEIIATRLTTAAPGIDLDEELVERAYGQAEGMPSVEADRRWPDGRYPGMESDHQLRSRGAAALRRIARERDGDGIVVAHGSLIRLTLTELCRTRVPRIENGSVSLVRRDAAGWRLLQVNRTGDREPVGVVRTAVVDQP